MDRKNFIQSLVDQQGRGLEIGPSYSPIVPKREGFNVDVLDHASADDLKAHYANDPNVDVGEIENVDFVSDGRPIHEVIGKSGAYDFIIASHVIEHVTDFVGFLRSSETLIKPTGCLILAVPDKRRCFDINRPLTTVGEVLDASLSKRNRHTPGKAFDHIFYSSSRDGAPVWTANATGSFSPSYSLALAHNLFESSQTDGKYHDVHGWVFVPSSFRLIVSALNQMGKIGLRPDLIEPGAPHEFIARMVPGQIDATIDYCKLMQSACHEDRMP